MPDRRVQALAAATRNRRERAEKAVEQALRRARSTTGPVTIAGIAADAGVSTDFIHKHTVVRPQIEALRRSRAGTAAAPDQPADADAAESTLIRRLTQPLAQVRKEHREQIAELRTALETAHGELLVLRRQLADGQ